MSNNGKEGAPRRGRTALDPEAQEALRYLLDTEKSRLKSKRVAKRVVVDPFGEMYIGVPSSHEGKPSIEGRRYRKPNRMRNASQKLPIEGEGDTASSGMMYRTATSRMILGEGLGLVDGVLTWVGRRPSNRELGPNPVTHVKGDKGEKVEPVSDELGKINNFKYRNGEPHAHRIRYETPNGPTSKGICVHCGMAKEGKNWSAEADFITGEEHRQERV